MLRWGAIIVVAGCSFEHGQLAPGNGASDGSVDDVADGSRSTDGAIDGPPIPTCGVSDPSLVWCLEFDEANLASAPKAIDGSGKNHHPSIANIAVTTRTVPAASQAITLTASSSITIPKPSDFNVQEVTLTAWIKREAATEIGVIDTAFQYTLSIEGANHTVQCAIASTSGTAVEYLGVSATALDEWDLIACTYDGAQACTYSYRNGSPNVQMGCLNRNSSTATNGSTSSAGEWTDGTRHFIGSLDQVRIYNRALTWQQICQAGGLSGC